MTQDEIVAPVARLDPDGKVGFANGTRPTVFPSEAMTSDGLHELLREVPEAHIVFGWTSQMWDDLLNAMQADRPTGPTYELDDLNEDGTWKPGRKPEGWGELP